MKFQELKTDNKIEYLLLILGDIRWINEVVDKLIISLKKWDIQDSNELDKIYYLVIDSINESNEKFDNEKFEQNKNLITYLKEKEDIERLEEQKLININF